MTSYQEEFGEVLYKIKKLALVVGDFHIPQRTTDVPELFKELLVKI
jgi:hypothetical protein